MKDKDTLIQFLDEKVLLPAETHPNADQRIKKKVRLTRMRLNQCQDGDKVEHYFWSAMATDGGIDSYRSLSRIGATTFEDVREEFKRLCKN